MYLAHMRTIVEEHFSNQNYISRAQYLQTLISNDVQNDPNKFYTYNDFLDNLNNQVTIPSSICPGLSQLMDARTTYLSNYWSGFVQPSISNIQTLPNSNQFFGGDLTITAQIQNASYAMLAYRFGENMPFENIQMYDDGNHNDGAANDGLFGVIINNCSNSIDYYLYADNSDEGVFSPKRAAYEFYNVKTTINQGNLVINEVMANNVSTVMDETGDYDDWIELYNNSSTPISTNGLLFSDNPLNLDKWDLPNVVINPNSYFIIWADEDGNTVEPIYASDTTWVASQTVPKYQSIDQAKLVPLLVKTTQELEARITALKTENETQATQIADLISRVTALENA